MSAVEEADALLERLRAEGLLQEREENIVHAPKLGDPPLGTRGGRLKRASRIAPFEFMVPARWLDTSRNEKEYG